MPQGNRKRISRKAGKGQFIKDRGTPAVPAGQCGAGAGAGRWPGCAGARRQGCPLTPATLAEPPVFCPGEPQKAAGASPAAVRGPRNSLAVPREALPAPRRRHALPVHRHRRSRLHLPLGLAFPAAEGRGKGGKVTQTLQSLAGAGGGEGEANSIEQLHGGPQICSNQSRQLQPSHDEKGGETVQQRLPRPRGRRRRRREAQAAKLTPGKSWPRFPPATEE